MAKQYTVIVTSTEAQDLRTHKVAQHSGDKGKALRIKAKAGETYQLVELQPGQAQSYAPQQVKVKRVGKDLVITFEGGSRPDIIIEGYYDVMPKDHKGLIGLAEDGNFYEYIPEDPHPLGMVQLLPEGGQDVAMALGAGEIIAPAEAAIAAFPLLGALGLLGGAAAAAYVINKDDKTTPVQNGVKTALTIDPISTDNVLLQSEQGATSYSVTGRVTGQYAVGDLVSIKLNGKTFSGAVAEGGTYQIAVPMADLLADPDTKIEGIVTGTGGDTATAVQDYTVEATNTPTKTALVINPVTFDNILNTSEKSGTVAITGRVTGKYVAGDVVSLTINGKTFTAVAASNGDFTVNVPGADLAADGDTIVNATVTGTGGTKADAIQDYGIDTTPPTVVITADKQVLAIGETTKITIRFSEPVDDGDVDKVVIAGGELYDVVQSETDPTLYTGTFKATSAGSASIHIQSGAGVDRAGNANVDGDEANNKVTFTVTNPISGKLSSQSDNIDGGNVTDNRTRDNTPTLTGTVPVGSTAVVTVNGVDYPATVNPDGTWTASIDKTNLPDGTYYPVLKVTQNGVTTPHNITPFTIDTTPPSIAITSNAAALAAGETATITFTLSEAVADFNQGDVQVTGGTLSNFQRDPSNPLKYTATFTPTAGSTPGTATINVANDKFSDAVANFNTDGAEANNTVTLTTNATVTGALQPVGPNDSGPLGDNITNDNTPTLKGKVPPGSTAKIIINGVEQNVTPDANGNWTYTVPNGLPDGTYTPQLIVTPPGSTTPNAPVPLTPFTIDTVPPSIVVTAPTSSLVAGQTTPITFTLSEPVADFDQNDIVVTGGTLSNFQQSATDPKVYTATFTPASTGTSATISVASSKFSDAAANYNTDGAETNNTVTLATNAAVSGGLAPVSDNSTGIPNDNTTNDATPELSGKAAPGSTVKIKIKDKDGNVVGEGTATVDPNGNWTYTQPDNLPDGTYSPEVIVNGGTPVPLKPFHIDTLPPTVIVSAPVSTLAAGASTTVTFTLTEAATDLTDADFVVTGGTLGALQQSATDPKVYTATFTSTNGGAGAVSIANNAFSDAAGNLNKDTYVNPASTGATYEANNTWAFNTGNPTPTPGATTGALDPASDSGVMGDNKTNDPTPTITGEVPAGSTAKIKLNGKEYPVDVKPDGSYSFTPPDGLPDGTYTPELIVTPPGATTPNAPVPVTPFTIDTKPPTIAITADKTQLLAGQTTVVTFTVSEAVSDFVAADITATGGTLGALTHVGVNSSGEDVYTAVFTPANNSTATSVITVGSGKFSDAANNFNTDGDEVNNTLMLPTNTVAGGGTGFLAPNSDSGTPGDNLTNDDTPTITGKVPPGSTASVNINGKDYPVTVNPDGSYSYTIPDGLPDGTYTPKIKVTPQGGGAPVESDGTPFTIDTTPPTVLVSSDKTSLTTGQSATITFTLSEDSSDFTLADVTATGGTLSNLQGSGKVYTATFTPSANSTATSTVKVDSLKFSDAAGNFNVDGADTGVTNTNIVSMATNTTLADTTAPTIAISADRSSLATGQTTLVTFTLSEVSSNFTADKVSLSSGTLTGFAQSPTNPLVYTATYTPAAGSTADSVISVASNKFSDAAGNNNADGADANNTVSLPTNTTPGLVTGALDPNSDTGTPGDNKTLDNTPTISGTAPPGSEVEIVIPGQNGQPDTVVKGKADENGQYSINVPDALPDGTYTPEIRVTPPGGPTSSTDGTPFTIDTMAPTILVASDKTSLSAGQTATITFTLSEASSDFTLADIQVTGGTLSNLQGSGTSYTATFTPTAGSTTTSVIHVASDKFSDAAGNFNADGADTDSTNTNIVRIAANTPAGDTTPPTILVERTNPTLASLDANSTETILFTLSEASTTFGADDIDVRGGTLSGFTPVASSGTAATGYTKYTAVFTPAANSSGTATIGVASGRFTDNAGNANKDTYVNPAPTGAETQLDANNTNQVSLAYNTTSTNPVDNDKPTIQVSIDKTSLAAGQTATLTFILSEASSDFTLEDIDVFAGNGAVSNLQAVPGSNGTQYTATYTAGSTAGTDKIGVAFNKFTDAADNANADTYQGGVVPPAYSTSLASVNRFSTFTISFTEAVKNFTSGDLLILDDNGQPVVATITTTGNWSDGQTTFSGSYTVPVSTSLPTSISINAGSYQAFTDDLPVGAVHEANNWVSLTNTGAIDTTPPTVAVSRMGSGTVGSAGETIVFTFSEGVPASSFVVGDIDAVGGDMSNLVPVETSKTATGVYTQYTATFVPTAGTNGTATIGVRAGQFTDVTGNLNKDTYTNPATGTDVYQPDNQVTLGYDTRTNPAPTDTTAPTIAISAAKTTLNAGETTVVTFTLSEPSTDFQFSQNDIATTGGTLSNFQPVASSGNSTSGYTQYTATFTPTGGSQGTGSVHVDSNAFRDAAGNYNQDGAEANNTVNFITNNGIESDTTPPTIEVLRLGSGTLTGNETIQFTLSEASKDFTLADIVVLDASGNPVTGTLSNFAAVPTSGTAGTGYTTYVATFTPAAGQQGTTSLNGTSGQLTVAVASSKFSDAAGNLNQDTYVSGDAHYEANNHQTISYNTLSPSTDTTPPTVIVGRDGTGNLASGQTDTITFTLSEASLTFDLSDVTVKDAQGNVIANALSNFAPVAASGTATGGYTVYTATFTPPSGSSTATIGVESDKFTDLAGNKNKDTYLTGIAGTSYEANNKVDIGYNTSTPSTDTTPPTVEVLRSGTGTMTGPETIYFNFSEPVATTSFTTADITYTGGQISNLVGVESSKTATGVYTQYIATFTPTAGSEGTATIGVKAGTFADAAGNNNKDTYESGVANTIQEDNNIVSASYDTNPAADTTPPTVAISRVGTTAVTGTDTIVFVFSEPVSNFALSDVVNTSNGQPLDATTQGALSNLVGVGTPDASGRYTQYTATYTVPTGMGSVGTVTLGIKAGTFNDASNNNNKDTYEAGVTNTVQEANNQLTLGWKTDTTPPTIGITRSGSGTLTSGTDTITFTLSEASSDFAQSMVEVDGGTLSSWTKTSDTTYTATFTPNGNSSGTATIKVDSNKFHDLAANANQDTYRTGQGANSQPAAVGSTTANQVDIAYDTRGATFSVQNDTASIGEDNSAALTSTTSGVASLNVLSNDNTATTVTGVAFGSTSGTVGQSIAGQYGSLTLNANGTYTYVLNNSNATVQALRTSSNTLSEVFTYTASDGGSNNGTANLVITITGTNDAPVAVADTATAVEAGGAANGTAGINPTGNVLTNDTDVDTGDTKTVSAISGGTVGTAKAGTYGSLTLNADGSYSYTLTQGNAAVEALLPTSTPLTDTFTYTVKDSANATHTATLTVTITGANDQPTVATAIADKTGTVGTALTPIDVTSNFADVDTSANGETATYSAKLVDSAGNLVNGGNLPSWLQLDATTGIFTGTPPAGTAAGDIYIRAIRTDKGGLSASDDFKITLAAAADTTPPTVAISSNQASLSSGQTATITFTFSEPVLGFEAGDIEVSSGTLDLNGSTTLAPDASSGDATNGYTRYTATYTPAAGTSTTATIRIAAEKFTDKVGNANKDSWNSSDTVSDKVVETDNTVTLTVNTTVASSLTLLNDTVTAVESGVTSGNTAVAGTNPSGNVTSNDTAVTSVTKIALSGGSDSTITAGSTSASNGTSVTGQYGTLVMGANGSYTYTVNNSNATVNALQVGGSLTEVFTYTATDGSGTKTANLSVTINGTNDAPTVAVALADQTGTTGTALSYTFDSGTFADVDTADTKTYTAQLVDSNGNLVGNGDLPSWLTFTAATRTFTGSTSNAAGTYYVKVTDTDSEDATASDIFKIVISDAVTPSVKTALSINPVTGDNLLDGTEQGTTNTTISGKVTGTFAEGDTVTLVVNGHNYTATAAADGSYSVSVPTSDLTADTDTKIEGSVTGGNGGQYATAAQSYVLDADAPSAPTKTALAIDPITADNVVLSSEKDGSNNITITGKVSGKFEAGTDTVTLTINGQAYTSAAVANDGTFSVDVAYSDLAADADTTVDGTVTGTGGTTATAVQNYALVDETPPTIAVTRSGSGDMTGNETITFTLSEASTDFAFEDVTVTGDGTLDSSTWQAVSSTVYTAIFIPTANKVGTASVGVKAGTFHDAANNANKDTYEPFVSGTVMEENNLQTMNVRTDVTPPTIAIDQITSPVTGATTVKFTLSEASTDFTAADVFVTAGAGSLSNWTAVSGTVYTATFTPTANSSGNVTIGVHANAFKDAAGLFNQDDYTLTGGANSNAENLNNKTDFTYNTDVTPPTVAITGPSGAVNGPVTITFTLSEVSADFALSDVVVLDASNNVVSGALTNFAPSGSNPLVYTATYTPPATSTGAVTINIASDTFKDPAGNFNKDGGDVNNHLPISYDTVKPTVAITTDNPNGHVLAVGDTATVTFTFSEKVLDFTAADIVLNGGTLDISGTTTLAPVASSGDAMTGYTRYTATFTPTADFDGVGSIAIGSAKFSDAAGNLNADTYLGTASEDLNNITSLAVDTKAPSQTVTFGSMTKDSGLTSGNANWTTADASAGRLVSGFLSAPLNFGETVQIWAKTGSSAAVLLGTATVNAAGTAWEFTDITNYVGATGATGGAAGWTYTAKVVDAAGNAGTATNQIVNGDYTEAAPVITAVYDSAATPVLVGNDPAASATNPATTTNTLSSISGTGVAGNTVYVYDNTGTNLVGSAVVQAGGTWTITGLDTNNAVGTGSNTFAAKQVDPLGNESVLSNLWTVTSTGGTNALTNPDFTSGATGFTTSLGFLNSGDPTSGQSTSLYTPTDPSTASVAITTVSTPSAVPAPTAYTFGTWTKDSVTTTEDKANPDGTMSGRILWGQLQSNVVETIWSQNVSVVAGKTYTFKFDYFSNGFDTQGLTALIDGAAITIMEPLPATNTSYEAGHFMATYTATTSKTISLALTGEHTVQNRGDFMLDNFSFVSSAPLADNSLVAGSTPPATPNPDTLAYTTGSLDALASDDLISVASTSLQATLAAGGFIDGGAGIDTLKLAAGTTLNLEALTANQTVKNIQEIEIFELQGYTTLQMSANDVLSLGGANASTMAPFSFASTQQVDDTAGGVTTKASGSTSSTGKVQMVIKGTADDLLKLDVLATDGTASSSGVSGNSGLAGAWIYKGTVQIGLITYKVYDHSTTQAQVLVDLPIVVNTISPIEIVSIDNGTSSLDTGLTGDFVTSDKTLAYTGTVPVEYDDALHDVWVEIIASNGNIVQAGAATVDTTNHTWVFDQTGATALTDGTYTIRSTIIADGTTGSTVGSSTVATPHATFGSLGTDTHPLVIDTAPPTVIVARTGTGTLSAGQSDTVTFTFSEPVTDFIWDEANQTGDINVTGGTLINFSGSGTTYTATFVPGSGSGTAVIGVLSHKALDVAGNENLDTYDSNDTGASKVVQADNKVSIDYLALPTQTVSFSSMTKDSGIPTSTTNNHDWLTNDGSAGRLVSGTLDAPLQSGQSVVVYSNGVRIGGVTGVATVNTAGTAWEITDTTGYTANWIYTAKVVDTAGNAGPTTRQDVNTDFTEAAPVITSVIDSANTSVTLNGTTANALSTVSGTGAAGDTVYLYDNTGTNLVGTTTVASNGTWTISGLASNAGVGAGSNTFSARQVDALGNASVLSNLWTVNAGGVNLAANGDFSGGNTGFTSAVTYHAGGATNFTGTYWLDGTRYSVTSQYEGYDANLETPLAAGATVGTGASAIRWATDYGTTTVTATLPNPDNAFTGNMLYGNIGSSTVSGNTEMMVWSQSVNVVAGKTYAFKFDYWNDYARLNASIGGQKFQFTTIDTTSTSEAGHFTATFVAQTTGPLDFKLYATAYTYTGAEGNFAYDNILVSEAPPLADNSLVAGGSLPFTTGVDGVSGTNNGSVVTYVGGPADMLAGDDVLNIGTNAQTLLATSGNVINGGAGVDTLKLAAGTVLNLETLTTNQTVKPIEQVEVFTLQGSSALTLSANDVLSLGGANLTGFNFGETTQTADGTVAAAGTTASTNKVQMVVNGTDSDTLVLDALQTDGVTTNNLLGNTGLAGTWSYQGLATTSAGSGTYKVYNQSTTGAQVLVSQSVHVILDDPSVPQTATFSSMTKDSSLATATADWMTNDASAGRLVSGTVKGAALTNGEKVKVYANGTLIGDARVNAAGTAWEITDLNGYNANWTYTAQVVNSAGKGGTATVQQVNLDNTEAAPVITAVTDSTSTNIANNGSTYYALSTVSGTGNAGDTVYLYDNTGTNLVGTTTVASNGTWSISGLAANMAVGNGSNAFSARQVDALGNSSALSNVWTVNTSTSGNLLDNGDLSLGNTGFTATETYSSQTTPSGFFGSDGASYALFTASDTQANVPLASNVNYGTSAGNGSGAMTYQINYNTSVTNETSNPGGYFSGQYFGFNAQTKAYGTFWADTISVVTGQTYNFSLDYINWNHNVRLYVGNSYVDLWGAAAGGGGTGTGSILYAHGWGTFTATTTGTLSVELRNVNGRVDFQFDNLYIGQATTPNNGSLVAGSTPPFTSGIDGVAGTNNGSVVTYTGGAIDMLEGNDVLNIGTNAQTLLSTSGNVINGGAGVDTLTLAAGTALNLEGLTTNQTVKPIQQVEVVQMQGGSMLALSANDVLSLGGANTGTTVAASSAASPMAPYSFTETSTGSSGSGTTSQGKVQFVVQGTASDALVLNDLKLDGVTTNGVVGNTGLSGVWVSKGTVTLTGVDGLSHIYKVYDHSETQAQVLVDNAMKVVVDDSTTITTTASFSSMTKDSSTGTANADWLTNDASAGRLVSGTLSAELGTNEELRIYANGNLLGPVRVEGTAWAVTDLNGYNSSWTYTAQVYNNDPGINQGGSMTTQLVTLDNTEAAPVITSVTDSANASIANNGSTPYGLSTVSGTGVAGDTIYLYDNTGTNLVGTTTVASNGTWSIAGLVGNVAIGSGANTFSARQVDALGNASVLSNLWKVDTGGNNLVPNGDFNSTSNYTSGPAYVSPTTFDSYGNQGVGYTLVSDPTQALSVNGATVGVGVVQPLVTSAVTNNTATGGSTMAWSVDSYSVARTATGATLDNFKATRLNVFGMDPLMEGTVNTTGTKTLYATPANQIHVEAGKTYNFSFNYWSQSWGGQKITATIDGISMVVTDPGLNETQMTVGTLNATYTARETKYIDIVFTANNGTQAGIGGDYWLDDINFSLPAVPVDVNLVAGGTPPFTTGADGTSTAVTYTGGVADMMAGNDVLNIGTNAQTLLSTSGNVINGGAGVDTLKLAAGTSLNLETLTSNQTVKSIEQVEVFELQGTSTLTLSANDVLSLGGSNASTMLAYAFGSTTQMAFGATAATGSTSSAGKVQLVVNGTSTDTVNLSALGLDGVTTNSVVGNTGLAGQWDYKGTTTITVGGVSTVYRVYDHSTTSAQVLIDNAIGGPSVAIATAVIGGTTSTENFDLSQNVQVAGSNTISTASGTWTIGVASTDGTALSTATNTLWLGYGNGITGSAVGDLAANSTDGVLFWVENGQGTPGRITTFTPTNPQPFDTVSFYYTDVNGPNDNNEIKFYDASGQLVHSAAMNLLGGSTAPQLFSMTLPTGVTATSFQTVIARQDQWAIDDLTTSLNGTANLINGVGSMDTTPLLKGTYQGTLNSEDVIKVFDGSTELGLATVDTVAKTWTYQVGTAASIGNHTYTAKILNSAGQPIDISSNFTLNILASPLVLDLNGNGIETTTLAAGAVFDLDANGSAERAAWVAGGDGLLVRDLNGDGQINSGAELFGSGTTLANGTKALDGFAALAGLDSNGDGVINASDAAFGQLQVWVDANGDAHTDAGELRSLADLGIASLGLQSQVSTEVNNGNAVGLLGSYTTTDGAEHVLADVWLQNQSLPVLDLTQVLSNAAGQGAAAGLAGAEGLGVTANLSNGQAELLRLNVSDVLAVQANANGQHVVQITGDSQDVVDLSSLLDDGHTTGTWSQNGTVVQGGVTFNAYSYSADASLQVLVDQHLQHVTLS